MSNIYRYTKGLVHYQLPYALNYQLTSTSLEAFRLICFVHGEAQRTSKSELSFTADEIRAATGIHPTNLGSVRDSLVNDGLLLVRKVSRGHHYIICDPRDRTPVPDGASDAPIDFDALSEDVLLKFFKPRLKRPKVTENGLSSLCPFPTHTDRGPSFRVELKQGTGGRWTCDGCGKSGKLVEFERYLTEDSEGVTIAPTEAHRRVRDRLRRLGVKESTTGKPDVVFSYCDEHGEIDSETVRPNGDKMRMYRRRPNPDDPTKYINRTTGCRTLLYRLPEVMEAELVLVVEGEPDVHKVLELHLRDRDGNYIAATTNAGGAGKWKAEHSRQLTGKNVLLIGDNDEGGKGLRHMEAVKVALSGIAKDIKHVILPAEYQDISHYLESHGAQDLIDLVGEGWLDLPLQI